MTDYTISLPKENQVHKPKLAGNTLHIKDGGMKLALSLFDTDGKEGLSSEELLQAFNYFVDKEKEVAVTGKKGDGIITSRDLEQILKNDSKFSELSKKLDAYLLSKVVLTLSALVSDKGNAKVISVDSYSMFCQDKNLSYFCIIDRMVTNIKSQTKEVDGKKVQICRNDKGEQFVKTEDGNHIYTNPDYVAKCLGLETESTWFGLGKNKYYVESTVHGNQYEYYYVTSYKWDDKNHSFKECGTKMYSNMGILQYFIGVGVTYKPSDINDF